jgi:hypothetical protein
MKIRLPEHGALMWRVRNTRMNIKCYSNNPGKVPLCGPSRRWVYNVKISVQKLEFECGLDYFGSG